MLHWNNFLFMKLICAWCRKHTTLKQFSHHEADLCLVKKACCIETIFSPWNWSVFGVESMLHWNNFLTMKLICVWWRKHAALKQFSHHETDLCLVKKTCCIETIFSPWNWSVFGVESMLHWNNFLTMKLICVWCRKYATFKQFSLHEADLCLV